MQYKPVSMKKPFFSILLILFLGGIAVAQGGDLLVRSGDKGLYLEHKVAPKENFFSIGRLYTVHPKYIAAYNKLDMTKGLAIGQALRIPLSDTNFLQKGQAGVPVYYRPGASENLAKISSQHRNVSVESLRGWNGISGNNVEAGKNIVVGFLVTKEMPSVTLEMKSPPLQETVKTKDPEPRKAEPPVVQEKKVTPPVEKKEPVVTPVVTRPAPVFTKQDERQVASGAGYFRKSFELQVRQSPARKEETVTSGIFKTTSGWLDSKYYMLIDGVQPGTIIRITNPANNKFIYAKVLGEMSGIVQNAGLNIRISSAGASALEIAEADKFIVKMNY